MWYIKLLDRWKCYDVLLGSNFAECYEYMSIVKYRIKSNELYRLRIISKFIIIEVKTYKCTTKAKNETQNRFI